MLRWSCQNPRWNMPTGSGAQVVVLSVPSKNEQGWEFASVDHPFVRDLALRLSDVGPNMAGPRRYVLVCSPCLHLIWPISRLHGTTVYGGFAHQNYSDGLVIIWRPWQALLLEAELAHCSGTVKRALDDNFMCIDTQIGIACL